MPNTTVSFVSSVFIGLKYTVATLLQVQLGLMEVPWPKGLLEVTTSSSSSSSDSTTADKSQQQQQQQQGGSSGASNSSGSPPARRKRKLLHSCLV
jgi:hypothetical protein